MSDQNVLPKVTIYQQYAGFADIAKGYGPTDDVADSIEELPDPVGKLFEAAPVNAALAKADTRTNLIFDWAIPSADDVDDDSTTQLHKSPMVVRDDGPRTLAKKLGVTRTEQVVTASGDTWLHGYDAHNQLVDARLIKSEHIENQVSSTRVSGVTPDAPGVRAVPRYGAREAPRPEVPLQFSKLVEIEE